MVELPEGITQEEYNAAQEVCAEWIRSQPGRMHKAFFCPGDDDDPGIDVFEAPARIAGNWVYNDMDAERVMELFCNDDEIDDDYLLFVDLDKMEVVGIQGEKGTPSPGEIELFNIVNQRIADGTLTPWFKKKY